MSYLKKYYKVIAALMVALLIIVAVFSGTTIKTRGYSVDNVYNTIKELSSDKYMGRRYGTEENMAAVKYIEEQFKSIGLKPAGEDDTYLRTYSAVGKKSNGVPVLEILDNQNKIIKSYKFGKDFNETGMGLSCSGEIFSGFSFIEYPNGLKSENFNADKEIAIMPDMKLGENQTQDLYMELKKAGVNALIKLVPNIDNNMDRTYASAAESLQKTGYEIPTLDLDGKIAGEIMNYRILGYKIHMKATIDPKGVSTSDVMGMIPGKTDDYLFISAHLDHVGTSADGRIYPGALNNASGTAAMLEIARYIKSQNKKPNKNIVFVAFNAEEGGALGSYNYVRHPIYPLYKTTVLNLDMIGANEDVPVKASYVYTEDTNNGDDINANPASKLMYQIKSLSKELGVPYVVANDISDHVPFNLYGVPAITIGDNDNSKIYTAEDDINNISRENIDRDMRLIMNCISFFTYSNGGLAGNKLALLDAGNFIKTQYPLIIIIIAILILLLFLYKTKRLDSSRIRRKIPLMTIALVMLGAGIVSYFPIRYPYAPIASSMDSARLFTEGILSVFKAPLLWPFYFLYIIPGVIIFSITKQRQLHWNYKGQGKELDIVFYVSMASTVILSAIANTLLFNRPAYYAVTPDFARDFGGKLVLHLIVGIIAYLFWKLFRLETNVKVKGYKGLISFALIFIILLSSFYMPIVINKYVFNANSSLINLTEEKDPHRNQ